MLGCKPVNSPIEHNHRLGEDCGPSLVDEEKYQRLVGKLIYLSLTRPDITYAVGVVSQFMHALKSGHLDAMYCILRYLKSSQGKGLLYSRNNHLRIKGYTDADWAGSVFDRRSTSGYCTFVGSNLVTWRSKKQPVVARSSAEAEFRAMAQVVCELIWLRWVVQELEALTLKGLCDSIVITRNINPVTSLRGPTSGNGKRVIQKSPLMRRKGSFLDLLLVVHLDSMVVFSCPLLPIVWGLSLVGPSFVRLLNKNDCDLLADYGLRILLFNL
ncbi:uncharacterized mitochondrial protein AtMg00810-like [Macadamia integrifolia]|uniref:uncharacterized mitochondrial protein AtMg00810-like n=1 Tax=Macadamia integrifolia TaxID=60698 RepID=UPI001C4FAFD6|nr:uncharacterized mitochondrial protein AtMg00810-like [Macadamia integrifolia]